ncbi:MULTISPECIES: ABC transporter ATP-binding protein [unclassified Halomonas]|uniref:ABC transporter ATP-binding protein n=1 Tax=unclassified Halomonas TaxID=2609666 RepID=UPI00209DF394|nr:ABC transporter ATP-binding protein [Halomonas sp. 707D7]MCP1328630.1 ABC transporter ATP-binding protein [Halomonas sp. 707D4]
MSRLAARGLALAIPGRATRPLELEIAPGQVWGVLGPNGAGKTTLLHTLAGLHAPRSGGVFLDGEPLGALGRREVARRLGLVFQERMDGFPATVFEAVMMGRHPYLSLFQRENAGDGERVEAALCAFDLAGFERRLVSSLSGGERQRVALATLYAQDPAVWLLDEPTNHLDLHHQSAVMALLGERAAHGRTVMMCLHDVNLAARWCSHALLLHPDGEAEAGPVDDLLELAALERLYRQPLSAAEIDGAPVFMPRRDPHRTRSQP